MFESLIEILNDLKLTHHINSKRVKIVKACNKLEVLIERTTCINSNADNENINENKNNSIAANINSLSCDDL